MARLTEVNDIAIKFTQEPDGENEILLNIQVVNTSREPLSGRFPLKVWFTANLTTLAETGTTYSGDVTAEEGSIIKVVTAKKNLECVTDANGLLQLKIVDTAETEDYAVIQAFGINPRVVISPAFVDWGSS